MGESALFLSLISAIRASFAFHLVGVVGKNHLQGFREY